MNEDEEAEFSQVTATASPWEYTPRGLDNEVRDMIEKPLSKSKIDKLNKNIYGCVYIVENKSRPKGHWKIGTTDKRTKQRGKEIQNACHDLIKPIHDSPRILTAKRAEEICHTHLKFFNRLYHCKRCKTTSGNRKEHTEYFELRYKTILRYVVLWTSFVEKEPYDENGKLKPFWMERLQNLQSCSEDEGHEDHDARLDRWNSFVNSTTSIEIELTKIELGKTEVQNSSLWKLMLTWTFVVLCWDLRGEFWFWHVQSRLLFIIGATLVCLHSPSTMLSIKSLFKRN
jgi:hypothetical protein